MSSKNQGFQNQVQQSSETAKAALASLHEIQLNLIDVENTIDEAERVCELTMLSMYMRKFQYFLLNQAINGTKSNADEARRNAQEAQEKYAEQASADAEAIRQKANETKAAAQRLREEADQLSNRLFFTQEKITKLASTVKGDNDLTDEAKEKVNAYSRQIESISI